jgi:hypothetical protein
MAKPSDKPLHIPLCHQIKSEIASLPTKWDRYPTWDSLQRRVMSAEV